MRRAVRLSANRQDDKPRKRERRERRPQEEAMLGRAQHFERVRRLPVHLPRHELRRPEVPVESLVGEELRQQANRKGEAAGRGDRNSAATGRAGLPFIIPDAVSAAPAAAAERERARLPRAGVGPREL